MPAPNGNVVLEKYINSIDPDDPEYQRQMMRPAEIKEDVKLMEQRKRVSLILKSADFRKDLEAIVKSQINGSQVDSLATLLQISDMLLPHSKIGSSTFNKSASMLTIPINDLRGSEGASMNKSERLLRCKLASLYRISDLLSWNNSIYNHITVRLSRDRDHFLINPFGMLYQEVTAGSLIKINMKGEVLAQGCTTLGVNLDGWFLHAAVHSARNDIRCVIHLTTPAAVTVSGMPCGLLPISQEAMAIARVSTYDPASVGPRGEDETAEQVDERERQAIRDSLQPDTKILLVKNCGLFAFGESIEEAFLYADQAAYACVIQNALSPLGVDQLVLPSSESAEQARKVFVAGAGGVNLENKDGPKWRLGEMEFEAMMRMMDNAGYRTGYMYRQPVVRREKTRVRGGGGDSVDGHEDVEIPPSVSSYATHTQDSVDGTGKPTPTMSSNPTHWFNTPNSYKKEEKMEVGTPYPKKITRWVANSEAEKDTSGNAVLISNPNQFAPQGVNPKELKENQKKVKAKYYHDLNSAGPQSKLLEGVSYEEAKKAHEEGQTKAPGEKIVVVGAASMGIIQRDFRHNAVVYQSVYAPNPFDKVTDDDIETYKKDVRLKTDPEYAAEQAAIIAAQEAEEMKRKQAVQIPTIPEDSIDIVDMKRVAVEAPSRGQPVHRAESERVTDQRSQVAQELKTKSLARSKSDKKAAGSSLTVPRGTDTLRSDTSGAEGGHDTEKEGKEGKDKKKKRKFKLPSFSRKSKDKDKK